MEYMTLRDLRAIINEAQYSGPLDEGKIGDWYGSRYDRAAQNSANAINGDRGFVSRNNLNVSGAADAVVGTVTSRFTDPRALAGTMDNVFSNGSRGMARAQAERAERERIKALEKTAKEAEKREQELKRVANVAKQHVNEAISPAIKSTVSNYAGKGFDLITGRTDTYGNQNIAGKNVTGSNVTKYRGYNPATGKRESINIATDTRSTGQQRADALANMGKGMVQGYMNQAVDAGISKLSDVGGYYGTKAVYAAKDAMANMKKAREAKLAAKAELERSKLAAKQRADQEKLSKKLTSQ